MISKLAEIRTLVLTKGKKTSCTEISGTYLYLSNTVGFALLRETDAGFSMFSRINKMLKPLGLRVCK